MSSFSSQTLEYIKLAGNLFRQSKRTIVLSGAGISTPSGIPDFRSEGSGLWVNDESMEAASLNVFRAHPERFFNLFRPFARQIYYAQPNAAHLALAKLEKAGWVNAIITQNMDMLHFKAGSQKVLEVHGSLRSFSCTQCYHQQDYQSFLMPFIEKGEIPRCPDCGAVLKPNVILFGEQLPQKTWHEAQNLTQKCDLMLVAGSSLEVLPVARLPLEAIQYGARLIIVNQNSTYLDERADVVIHENVAIVLPAITDEVMDAISF
jgi:NAD-dependent deacetylase